MQPAQTQMNPGIEPTTASLLSQLYPQQATMSAPVAPQQQPPQESWLQKLLPTAGGLIGGLGGSLIAPFAGSVGGAALGSAAGRALENALTGKKVLQANDLTAGLEGGVGQGVGFGVGKLASGLLGKLATSAGGAIKGANAESALASEFPDVALSPKMKQNLNFGQSLAIADKAGIPKTAQGFADARGVATGANGYLNGVLDDIVRMNPHVPLDKYSSLVETALRSHPELGEVGRVGAGMKPSGSVAATTKKLFDNMLQETALGGEGSLSPNMLAHPDNALALLRQVRELGQKYVGSEPGTQGAALGDVYQKVYQGLKDTIYNRPEINAAIKAYVPRPSEIESLTTNAGGNKQLAQHLAEIATNAGQAGDLLKPQAQFMNMGEAGERALNYLQNAVGTNQSLRAATEAAQPAQGLLGMLGHGLLGKAGLGVGAMGMASGNPMLMAAAVPSILGSGAVKNVTSALADKLTGGGVQKAASKIIAPTIMGASQFLSHSPDYAETPTGDMMNGGTPMQPGMTQLPGGVAQPQMAMQSPQQQLYQAAMIAMQDPYLISSAAPLLQQAAGPIQKAQTAQSALQGTEQAFAGAGGGQGMLGGLLSKLGGAVTGGSARSFAQERAQLATVLTSLGVPASAIPDVTDTSTAAMSKWQTLSGIISSMGGGGLLGTVPTTM